MLWTNWWRPLPALALLLAGTSLSASAGTPAVLPGVALEWPLLLHLERGALLLAGLALVLLVGARATLGEFPFRLGQLEYAIEDMAVQQDRAARLQREHLKAFDAEAAPRHRDKTDLHI
jgi:hypothetical protein